MQIRKFIRKIVRNPYIDFVVGAILMVAGLMEVFETLPEDISNWKFGAHHAVILLGFVTLLRSIVDIFAGVEFLDKTAEAIQKKS